jgi:hypothetical protein
MFGSKMPDFSAMGKGWMDKMSKGTGTDMVTTGGGSGAVIKANDSPLGSMKQMFASMQESLLTIVENTTQTNELLKGTDAEQRDEKIGAGDTDKEKGPGILSKVGSTLGKLNPFGGGGLMDTLGKLALAIGGVTLIKLFGDNAIGPIAALIESIKKGKIGDNISSAYEYIKKVGTGAFKELKEGTILFIDGVKKMFKLISGAYTAINDYVMSFDTKGGTSTQLYGSQTQIKKGDGILDKGELKDLRNDLISKVATYIGDLIGDVFKGVLALIPLSSIVPLSVGLGFSLLKGRLGLGAVASTAMVAGGANAQAAATRGSVSAAKFGMAGALKVAGIGLIVANSIFQTYQGITNALENSLKDDGTTDYSSFVAYFFGGQKKGSGLNAIIQANSVGGMFAGPAALAGLAVGGLPGALIGGALGYGVGVIVGGISGYLGADNLDDVISMVGSSLKDGLLGIANFFNNFVEGIANLGKGGSFTDPFTRSELDRKKKKLKDLMEGTNVNPFETTEEDAIAALGEVPAFDMNPSAIGGGYKLVAYNRKLKDILNLFNLQEELKDYIKAESFALPSEIETAQAALDAHNLSTPAQADPSDPEQLKLFGAAATDAEFITRAQIRLDAAYKGKKDMLEKKLLTLIRDNEAIKVAQQNLDFKNVPQLQEAGSIKLGGKDKADILSELSVMLQSNNNYLENQQKLDELGHLNQINSNNTQVKGGDNNLFAGLSINNSNFTANELNDQSYKMV